MPSSDTDRVKDIRDQYSYEMERWRDIRSEGDTDMRYLSGDPWDPREKAKRRGKRPALVFDELMQYVNQLVNDIRQNKRSIKVIPKGAGANDKTSELRGGIIRQVEYKSNAQSAYVSAFEGAAQRGYGYARVSKRYVGERSFEQELVIKRVVNPNSILLDWNAKEADASDMDHAFVLDRISRESFKKRWPKAKVTDFSDADFLEAPEWGDKSAVLTAEYWKVNLTKRKLLLVDIPKIGSLELFEDEFKEQGEVLDERKVEQRKIAQCITNGFEILEESDWDGTWIPIVPCFGRELYVDDGAGSKRMLLSLIRLARDPYMLYCWMRTNEMEEAAMTPKVPFQGVVGQFTDDYIGITSEPKEFVQYNAKTEQTGDEILTAPTRQPFEPNFIAYEQACEGLKRSIQAAMGRYNASVGKSDSAVKSGIAIKALDSQSDQGSFHFIDNYERFLEHVGRICNEQLDYVYDTKRDVGVRSGDDIYSVKRINDPEHTDKSGNPQHLKVNAGEHDVTISTGPSFHSQREEAMDWANQLAQVPGVFPLIGDLLTKLRDVGPIGDEIAKRLTPPQFQSQDGQEPLPPQAVQAIQQSKQQLAALNAYAQKLEAELKKLQDEKQGKVVDNEYRMSIEKLKIEASVTIAEIGAKAQEVQTRLKMEQDVWKQLHGQAHEAATQAVDHAHETDLATQPPQPTDSVSATT